MMRKSVITVRYRGDEYESRVVMERSFLTPKRAMAYQEVLQANGIYDYWHILEEVDSIDIGHWNGKDL